MKKLQDDTMGRMIQEIDEFDEKVIGDMTEN